MVGAFLGGPPGAAVGAAVGGVAAGSVAALFEAGKSPWIGADKIGRMVGAADPFFGMQVPAYALARAGGYGGRSALDSIYSPKGPMSWEQHLGIGPMDALNYLDRFGIVQRHGSDNAGVAQALGRMAIAPALSGMPLGALISGAGQAAGAGLVQGGDKGVMDFMRQLSPVMAEAVAIGAQRAPVLHAIQATIAAAIAGGGGAGFTPAAVGRVIGSMGAGPSERTGAAGASYLHGVESFYGGVDRTPLPTLVTSMLSRQLKTRPALMAYFSKYDPSFAAAVKSNPAVATMVDRYVRDQASGNSFAAAKNLGELLKQFPGAGVHALETSPLNPYPAGTTFHDMFISGQAHVSYATAVARDVQQHGYAVPAPGGPGTLGHRLNNPGNLSFAGQMGNSGYYVMPGGRKEARFSSMRAGLLAMEHQMLRDQARFGVGPHNTSQMTIADLVGKWNPSHPRQAAAEAAYVAAQMGLHPGQRIDLRNPATMNAAAYALSTFESGPGTVSRHQVAGATGDMTGQPLHGTIPTSAFNMHAAHRWAPIRAGQLTADMIPPLVNGLMAGLEIVSRAASAFDSSIGKAQTAIGSAGYDARSGMSH